ncbi:MAG: F0F1 ATP synthase subunit gamma, partial [Bacteroidetes bacterium]|nr:F0F1 ATP synthase subunit gamma [Bacteroidota bacterium]
MANLKEIRSRIKSVQSTQQITSAMKMVSAAKLRRAQDAIIQMRPYSEKLQEILANLSSSLDASENAYAEVRDHKKVLIIAISSNRGLAGAFNANIVKAVDLWKRQHTGIEIEVLGLGKKASDGLKKRYTMVNGTFSSLASDVYENLNFTFVSQIATEAMQRFTSGQYDQVFLVY